MNRRQFLSTSLAGAVLLGQGRAAIGASAPEGRIVIGIARGGQTDTIAKQLAMALGRVGDVPYAVEAILGGNGQTAMRHVMSQPGDGRTLLFSGKGPFLIYPALTKSKAVALDTDLVAVAEVCETPFIFTVGPRVPNQIQTLEGYFEWLRRSPSENYLGISGYGTTSHLLALAIARESKALLKIIMYTSSGAVAKDLRSGHLSAGLLFAGQAQAEYDNGLFRALAVSSGERWVRSLDIPTLTELGYENCDAIESFAVYMSASTPDAVLQDMHILVKRAYQEPQMDAFLDQAHLAPTHPTMRELRESYRNEMQDLREIIRRSGISLIED